MMPPPAEEQPHPLGWEERNGGQQQPKAKPAIGVLSEDDQQSNKEQHVAMMPPPPEEQPYPLGWEERNGDHTTAGDDATMTLAQEQIVQQFARTVRKCRKALLTSGLVMLIASTLLIVYGLPALDSALVSFQIDVPNLQDIVGDAQNATSQFVTVFDKAVKARLEMVDLILDSCDFVNDTVSDVILNLKETLELPLNGDRDNLLNESYPELTFYTVVLGINETLHNSTIIGDTISVIDETLFNVTVLLDGLDNVISFIEGWWYYPVGAFIIILMLTTLSFMIGTILAWRKAQPPWLNRTNSRYLLPFFCLSLFISYFIATYSLIYSALLSDYCINSPDEQTIRMLQAPAYLDEFIEWYFEVCFRSCVFVCGSHENYSTSWVSPHTSENVVICLYFYF
jgi:hypothetical protein